MSEEEINQYWMKHRFEQFPEVIEWYCVGFNDFYERWDSKIIKSNSYAGVKKLFSHSDLFDRKVCPNTRECVEALFREIWD